MWELNLNSWEFYKTKSTDLSSFKKSLYYLKYFLKRLHCIWNLQLQFEKIVSMALVNLSELFLWHTLPRNEVQARYSTQELLLIHCFYKTTTAYSVEFCFDRQRIHLHQSFYCILRKVGRHCVIMWFLRLHSFGILHLCQWVWGYVWLQCWRGSLSTVHIGVHSEWTQPTLILFHGE